MTTTSVRNHKAALRTIVLAGFFAGSLDAIAAVLSFFIKGGKDPFRIFQYIASAAFGKEAFSGSWALGGLGILFHFVIAYSFTILFFFLYKRWPILSKNIVITPVFYGIFIWVIMNLVVLRMSKLTLKPFVAGDVLTGISVLVIAIGLPVTLFARKYYAETDSI